MPLTLDQLKDQLSVIEPDESMYMGIGVPEIPFLEQLLDDAEGWMASRAVFALSRIPDAKAVALLSEAIADPRPEVRVAIAASVRNLKPEDANNILLRLFADSELGVRKFAVKSVSNAHNTTVREKLRNIQTQDSVPQIRELAQSKLEELAR
jgi:HEAT repeat protein